MATQREDRGIFTVKLPSGDWAVATAQVGSSGGVVLSGGAFTDRSGAITTGGTAQTAAPANTSRSYLLIQNKSAASESFWVNFDGTTAVTDSPSIEIAKGASFTFEGRYVPTGAISVIAATTGTKYTIREA